MISKLFDHIGSAITSLGAVIFVLLMIITGMIFFSHTLFLQVFPASMQEWEKILATWVMALGWELTVLITTVNTKHINKRIPWLMAIASGVIVLFFIQAFDRSLTALEIAQRWFVGLLAAALNYIYADLFYAKWQERNSNLAMPGLVIKLDADLTDLRAALHDAQRQLREAQAELQQVRPKVKELESLKAKDERDRTCPWCKEIQDNTRSLNSHKGHCPKNPRNFKPN